MSQENVELVRGAYVGLAEHDALGDWSWFFDEFASSDIELQANERYFDARPTYHGEAGWTRFWRDFADAWDSWTFNPVDFLDAADVVVAVGRATWKGRGSGVAVTEDEFHVWWIRDGKAVRVKAYSDRGEALEAAGLSE
jgi:ketosteroid isomerase-like protein